MIGDGQLNREAEESTRVRYRKTGNVSVSQLNGETSVDRGVGGGHRRDESPRVISSRPGERRCRGGVGGRWLDTEEGLLTHRDVAGNGESVENERKDDDDAYLPLGGHDGRGHTALGEGKRPRTFDTVPVPRTPFSLGRHAPRIVHILPEIPL